jgi:hypothetical protein
MSGVSDLLGIFFDSLGDRLGEGWLRGGCNFAGLLLLFIESLFLVGPLDFLLGSGGLEGVLIVGDVQGFERICHWIFWLADNIKII